MIKIIDLTANKEQKIDLSGGLHVRVQNLGDSTVYVCKNSGIITTGDNVLPIQSGDTDIVEDVCSYGRKDNDVNYFGSIYVLAESDTKIVVKTQNHLNFKLPKKGGGEDGKNGLSAYEIWLNQGNIGTEVDFLNSLKGDKGEQGEQGLQGIQGEKGETGADGFSPTVTVAEDTSTSYTLTITDINGSFTTPNLKGQDASITVDSELNAESENPIQNKVITSSIAEINNKIGDIETVLSTVVEV